MNIQKKLKMVHKLYGALIDVTLTPRSIILNGEMDNINDIVNVGYLFVDKRKRKHVVNEIKLKNRKIIKESINVESNIFNNKEVDVLVIGGGVIGCSILRELSKWNLSLLLIEKEADVGLGASGANDGMIHLGIDLKPNSLKAKYCLRGNKMYEQISRELGLDFRRCGQYLILNDRIDKKLAYYLLYKAKKMRLKGVRKLSKKEIYQIEPNIFKGAKGAIGFDSTGIICPYKATIAYAESAIINNAKVSLETKCIGMKMKNNNIISVRTNKGEITPKVVINCAGVYADDVAKMANDKYYSIHPRRGTDLIFDKKVNLVNTIISRFPKVSTNKNHTKGGGIVRTIDGNILVGPDAVEIYDKDNNETTKESINNVFYKHHEVVSKLNKADIIAYFSGIRACTYEEDFIVEVSKKVPNFIHVAGIQSPGLTSAPAIAEDVCKMVIEILSKLRKVEKNSCFNPYRKVLPKLAEMEREERDKLIKKNPDYGKIVCRCEEVSLGEIKDAINSVLKVDSIDAIKRRVRPGMGRCQGGFCMPIIMKILSSELGIEIKDVNKRGTDTAIGVYNTKSVQFEVGDENDATI